MRKLMALVVSMAFALGVALAAPQTFAQAPAPKDGKKAEKKKPTRKVAKAKKERRQRVGRHRVQVAP
jgi:hypothetical protein